MIEVRRVVDEGCRTLEDAEVDKIDVNGCWSWEMVEVNDDVTDCWSSEEIRVDDVRDCWRLEMVEFDDVTDCWSSEKIGVDGVNACCAGLDDTWGLLKISKTVVSLVKMVVNAVLRVVLGMVKFKSSNPEGEAAGVLDGEVLVEVVKKPIPGDEVSGLVVAVIVSST